MSKWINIILHLLPVVLAFYGIFNENNVLMKISMWGLLYTSSFTTAKSDREVDLARINLPLWAKRILFPCQSNPFRGKTIIFQIIWTTSNMIVITLGWLFPSIASILFAGNFFFMLIFVGHWCDMTFRKKSQIKKGIRPNPKENIENVKLSGRWWDNNRCK